MPSFIFHMTLAINMCKNKIWYFFWWQFYICESYPFDASIAQPWFVFFFRSSVVMPYFPVGHFYMFLFPTCSVLSFQIVDLEKCLYFMKTVLKSDPVVKKDHCISPSSAVWCHVKISFRLIKKKKTCQNRVSHLWNPKWSVQPIGGYFISSGSTTINTHYCI